MKDPNKGYIISWGGGVNSTAIIALHLLGKLEGKPEIVFADTGCEYPDTYTYIDKVSTVLAKDGWKVTILRSNIQPEYYLKYIQEQNLYQWLWNKKTIPFGMWRRCSGDYKRDPIKKYVKKKMMLIGICKDELKRIKAHKNKIYPIKDYTRDECIELIEQAELPPAHKTGCWFCPFQRKSQWINLYNNHRTLWDKAVALENNSKFTYKTGISIEEQMDKWIEKGDV